MPIAEQTQKRLELHLGDPGMTLLHRAGLAGLYMTLKALEPQQDRRGNLQWQLTRRSVVLEWSGEDQAVLDWLLKQSFGLSADGVIRFTALENAGLQFQNWLIIHQGLRGTFLQHTSTYKADPQVQKSLQIDEGQVELVVSFPPLRWYRHQEFAQELCDSKGRLLKTPISVAGWLNPGAIVRHEAFNSKTGFEEPPALALVLLYAPIACQYFLLRSRLRDKRAKYALVIPEVKDLEMYAKRRRQLCAIGYADFHASDLGDAALMFATFERTLEMLQKSQVERCQVVTLGTVAWSKQQRTRTAMKVVEADAKICQDYLLIRQLFQNRRAQTKEGKAFIASSFAREIFAANLAAHQPWYADFANHISSRERFKKISYERGGLHQMIQHTTWENEVEYAFVLSFHEALRRRYGKVAALAKDKKEIPNFDRVNEELRTGILRCKNAATFREFITDFWSRAGSQPVLQDNWREMIRFINDPVLWRTARDLSLLALASYKGIGQTEDTPETDEEEIE